MKNFLSEILIQKKKINYKKLTYKNYFYNDDNRVYEIIYETEKFSIMKGFSVKLVKGHYNPMVRISNDKYSKFSSYFIKLNNIALYYII